MQFADDDRVQVSRVIVERGGILEEIPSCWIAVTASRNRVGIWLTENQREPTLMVSLDQVMIEWQKTEMPPMPS